MPRSTLSLRKALQPLKSSYQWSSSSPPVYSIGLSYAGKDSPPFNHPSERQSKTGFANTKRGLSPIRDWVIEHGSITAGRGELESTAVGGWTEEVKDRVKKWGAGEDFFSIEGLSSSLSVSCCSPRKSRPVLIPVN